VDVSVFVTVTSKVDGIGVTVLVTVLIDVQPVNDLVVYLVCGFCGRLETSEVKYCEVQRDVANVGGYHLANCMMRRLLHMAMGARYFWNRLVPPRFDR
jgi:hypothetical protein